MPVRRLLVDSVRTSGRMKDTGLKIRRPTASSMTLVRSLSDYFGWPLYRFAVVRAPSHSISMAFPKRMKESGTFDVSKMTNLKSQLMSGAEFCD